MTKVKLDKKKIALASLAKSQDLHLLGPPRLHLIFSTFVCPKMNFSAGSQWNAVLDVAQSPTDCLTVHSGYAPHLHVWSQYYANI